MALPSQSFSPLPKPLLPGMRESGYFQESRQPIYSAALVLPFLLAYEIGLIVLRSDLINGGQAILKQLGAPIVRSLGVSGSLVSIVFIAAAFVIWQVRSDGKWKIQPPVLIAMFMESFFFALLLFLVLRVFVHYVADDPSPPRKHSMVHQSISNATPPALAAERMPVPCATRSSAESGTELRDFVLYCGAGVYEELVFRVMLLGLLMLVLTQMMHMEHAYAAAWSVAIGAIIFSAYHHIGASGDKFELNVFLQRLIAGLYFSALYYNRSFGIAAASHALYDILVGLNRLGS